MSRGAIPPAVRFRSWRSFALVGVLLAIWAAGAGRSGRRIYLPSPFEVAASAVALIRNGELIEDWTATLARLLGGFLLGGIPAVAVGIWLGVSSRSRETLDPLIAALHAVPKIAAYPLFLIVFGLGESSKIAIIAISTFFPLVINTMAGVDQLPRVYFDVARNYGASPRRILQRLVLPGSLPLILTGGRIAMTLSLLLTIAVEMIGATSGLGYRVWMSWETLQVSNLYVALILAALTGIGIRSGFDAMAASLLPWKENGRR
jgi:ABC-type nitrate/sulfonate/bicarbonate transport system permease component